MAQKLSNYISEEIKALPLQFVKGFIINTRSSSYWSFIHKIFSSQSRHWSSIVRIKDIFYDVDSKLENPELIGNENAITKFLLNYQKDAENYILVVYDSINETNFIS
ncbi:hypothetical protein HZS_6551 [Henneguya salminicola]|nr:hypothetical protein HZS_6551 [Henneguya salminicola]